MVPRDSFLHKNEAMALFIGLYFATSSHTGRGTELPLNEQLQKVLA